MDGEGRSGIHPTGVDSGWPVGSDAEPDPHKDGSGTDDGGLPKVTGVDGDEVTTDD